MKSNALKIAHQLRRFFSNWSQAVKAGWILAKLNLGYSQEIKFAKKETGELREAKAIAVSSLSSTVQKGFVRFLEQVEGRTQWRSFRVENLILNF